MCFRVCVCALSKKTLIWLTPVNFPAPLDLSSEHLYMQWYVCEKLCQISTKSLRLWALLADCTIHNSVTVLYHLLSPHTTSSTSLCNLLEFAKFCLSAIFSGFWYLFLSSLFVVAIVCLLLLQFDCYLIVVGLIVNVCLLVCLIVIGFGKCFICDLARSPSLSLCFSLWNFNCVLASFMESVPTS